MKLSFKTCGSGQPVVILHGLFGSRENWDSLMMEWAKRYQVFAVDLRNHGRSPHMPGMTYRELSNDVVEFIDSTLSDTPHLLGHSMGGKIAMQTALDCPEKVRTVSVADIGPQAYPALHRHILKAMLGLNLTVYSSRKQVEDALAPEISDLATRRFLLKNLQANLNGGYSWKLGLQEISDGYDNLTSAVSVPRPYSGPALFLKGEDSAYLDVKDFPRIRELFPNAEFEIIPRAGHWMQVENPGAVIQALTQFWSRHLD